MAFAIRTREKKKTDEYLGLLDRDLLQELQDHFCEANNVYLACISKKQGVITNAYGSREELLYIHSQVSMDMHMQLLNRLISSNLENVVELNTGNKIARTCGISVRINGEIVAIWIAIGIMAGTDPKMPEYMLSTNPDQFYKSIQFLETLSKEIFAVKQKEQMAQEAFLVSRASESKMEEQLRRNEVMTAVVKELESEQEFTTIVDEVFANVGEYLHLSNAILLREDASEEHLELVCEYKRNDVESLRPFFLDREKASLPFFNGRPYMVSSNSLMPEAFRNFFKEGKLKAGIFLPIEIEGKNNMYLCFVERKEERVWDVNEIKLMNDVRRIIQSILIKRIAKNSLATSYASLEAVLENVGCGICVKNIQNHQILYTNQKYLHSFQNIFLSYKGEQHGEGRFLEYYFEEEQKWFEILSNRIQWVDGSEVELTAIFDITEKKNYEKKIEKQENYDLLTGLFNRSRLEQDLKKLLKSTKEQGKEGAFLYIDLDDFKHINDGLGHHYGDVLLQNIAEQLMQIQEIREHCYRMGGDEFAILVTPEHYAMLYTIIDTVWELFEKPWLLNGTEYYCTMSMSVVRFPKEVEGFDDIIKNADAALFDAKDAGKNRVIFYAENRSTDSHKRLDMEKHMRDATRNHMEEFEVYFQPVVDVTKQENVCVGAEALVRWNSKKLGFVSPVDFIPLAEYLGLIVPIGEHILRTACKQCKYWNDMGHPEFTINVNLSVVQLLQPDIVEVIKNALEESNIIPEHLHLEVTESLAVNDMERMKTILGEIKGLGVKVALDDFGTGYSSLNHIREMPIDIIKIDRCFIIDIGKDHFSNAFVKMVTELAAAIGMITCVEGVEEEEQVRLLKEMNVNLIQGYYFGKPMDKDSFEKNMLEGKKGVVH